MATKSTKDYNSVDWASALSYCEDSPSGLRWKISPAYHVKIGDKAGSIAHNKMCWELRFTRKTWLAHRIIWVLHNGSIQDDLVINHKDCNPMNNRIENLELVSVADNNRRTTRHINNDETLGIHKLKSKRNGKEYHYYSGFYIDGNGKVVRKCFSINKYGDDSAKKMAKAFRDEGLKRTGIQYGQPSICT